MSLAMPRVLGLANDFTHAALICTRALSSHLLEEHLLTREWTSKLGAAELRAMLYREQYPWAARLPDHVFESSYRALLTEGLKDGLVACTATGVLAREYLQVREGRVFAKLANFGAWQQSVASRVSPLPMIAAALAQNRSEDCQYPRQNGESTGGSVLRLQPLPVVCPQDPVADDWIARHGLNETHLHLNGSTHAETCWLRALHRPDKEARKFSRIWQRNDHSSQKVRELANTRSAGLSPTKLRKLLVLGKRLRGFLIATAIGRVSTSTPLPISADGLLLDREGDGWKGVESLLKAELDVFTLGHHDPQQELSAELHWMERLLVRLQRERLLRVDRMFHLYLLLQNRYRQLLVQSEEQYGFDQFQKFTYTDLRDQAEKTYSLRFSEIHGAEAGRSQTAYLEGRFSPKSSVGGNIKLLASILSAYHDYIKFGNKCVGDRPNPNLNALLHDLDSRSGLPESRWPSRQQLCLVAHFVKHPWKKRGPYRFFDLRRQLEGNARILDLTLREYPRLRRWVRGVDGAANELHAPPEVFASVFRMCAHMGLTNKTFHVGEDFPHLLTGIRHMYDAIELLDLREGARIGHGTAMGIDPDLWISRMPAELMVTRGDHLLDLLAAWRLLRQTSSGSGLAYRVECQLADQLPAVFDRYVSPSEFERAMQLRGLHMDSVAGKLRRDDWDHSDSVLASLRAERKLVEAANKNALKLLWEWHSDRALWARSEELISVQTCTPIFDSSVYLCMQQELMRLTASRTVVIETLPTSNVRISQYESFWEHHALRWMRVPGYLKDNDPAILVSLGSDDPGIFANDLRSDFYHLYAAMRRLGLSDNDALVRIGALNERGRQYRFHDQAL